MNEQFYSDLWVRDQGESWDYRVDLVRESLDDNGLKRQQRLSVATYPSQGEAEEHQAELDQSLAQDGIEGLGKLPDKVREQEYEITHYCIAVQPEAEQWLDSGDEQVHLALIAYSADHISTATLASGDRRTLDRYAMSLEDTQALHGDDLLLTVAHDFAVEQGQIAPDAPLFADQLPAPEGDTVFFPAHHIDGGGIKHWFEIVENHEPDAEPYELRYFRELNRMDGTQRSDSYPIMPLADNDPDIQPLQELERYMTIGDVYTAQQLAHDVSANNGGDFPSPLDIPALDPQPEYYFGYGTGENNRPSLEAVKTWMDGAERRFDTLTINEYDSYEDAAVDEYILDAALVIDGLEQAMNIAERWAVANGYLDLGREDGRIFFEDDAPPDPFTTHRGREMPDYGFGAISANGEHFVDVVKSWGDDGYDRLTIPQLTWEEAQLQAEMAFTDQQNGNLQGAMRRLEALAEDAGVLDPERMDGQLFMQGPPDPFETLRQQDIRENPFLYRNWPPEQANQTMGDDFNPFLDPPQPDVAELETIYHRLDVMHAQTPDGIPLGYMVLASAYPDLPQDFDGEEMDDTMYPAHAWALPFAHLDSEQEALDYRDALLDASLADAVGYAEDHGLSTEWQQWDMNDINRFMAGSPYEITVADWQPTPNLSDEFEFMFNDDPDPSYPSIYREAAEEAHRNREARASLEGVAWFEAGFTDKQLIEPLDDTVNYAFVVQDTDPRTLELMVDKYWKAPNGYVGFDSVTLKTYDPDDEMEREQADQDRDTLMQSADDLSGMMQNAEQMAVENGYLKADRANLSLFRKGPPDRFETLAERLIKENDPDIEAVDNPHWRFDTLPINNPEGQELGVALHMVRYPTVEAQPNIIGSPSIPDDTPFELLEVAHFPTKDDADVFVDRFVGYLSDDLTAPELAEEVARGEGLSAEWKTLDEAELQAYQDLSLGVMRDGGELNQYNPVAERYAQIEAEKLYYDPIHNLLDGDSEPVSPDFDL